MNFKTQLKNNILEALIYARTSVAQASSFTLKGEDDPVTQIDKDIEQILYKNIPESVGRNGEEFGSTNLDARYVIHVDPLDGTKDFIRGNFNTSISVAVTKDKELIYGAIADVMKDILYEADEITYEQTMFASHIGQPHKTPQAYLNGLPQPQYFQRPTIITEETEGSLTKHLIQKGYSVRRPGGSIALSMALVAAGTIDAIVIDTYTKYQENKPSDIADIAAGVYQLTKITNNITTRNEKEYDVWNPYDGIIAARPEIDKQLREDIKEFDLRNN